MKKTAYILHFLVVVAAFLAGTWYQHKIATRSSLGGRKALYYVDPMHPAYKSDKPGIAPDCGMELVAVYAGQAPGELTAERSPIGTVAISAEKQQLFGVRVGRVEKASDTHTLRLFGRVVPDETRIYKLNAGIDGYIQTVSEVTTGSQVKKDQLLATFSAPNAVSTIQTYILNAGAEDRFKQAAAARSPEAQALPAANSNVQQRIQQMEYVGMSRQQMEEIRRTQQVPESIRIMAPAEGFVLARNVSPGQKFERGVEWYRIADLRRVWILADVFENEAQYLRPGMRAQVSLPHQNKTLPVTVSEILPQFDPNTRTLKVRLEADNPGNMLRPDMFVDVEFPIHFAASIAVPVDAVMDSGRHKTVFVDRGNGFFEPRAVETGWRFGSEVEIVSGLAPGEQIVVSGTFLVDSESRLKAAAAGIYSSAVKDPVCGMEVDAAKARAAGRTLEFGAQTYFFCSDQCKRDFEKSAEPYLRRPAASGQKLAGDRLGRGQPETARTKDSAGGKDVDKNQVRQSVRQVSTLAVP